MNRIYNTATKRVLMRFLEIFLISGAIGLLESPDLINLVPPILIGSIAAIIKLLREWKDKELKVVNN